MALRLSRPVKAVIATGIAASSIAMVSLPAAATTVRDSEWWMSALSIRGSWPVARGAGITIAVLNDGVDVQQPDLTGATVTTGPDYTGTSQSSGQYFGEIGTGVAALIAGHGYGVDSLSGMLGEVPLAHILSIRATLPPNDPLLAQSSVAAALPGAIADGIRYAVSHGASVIDLPVDPGQAGIAGTGGAASAAGGSAAEAAAVKFALSRDVVLVAPAGDDNLAADSPNYPAAYPGVIAVGAFDKNFVKAPWTSHQSYVTVTAAGSGLLLPTNTGTFQPVSGTSYASAVVTGIVAMMQGRFPGITVTQVRKALITGTVFHGTGGRTNGSGYGTVNAARALSAAAAELAAPATLAGAGGQPLAALTSPARQASHQSLTHSISRDAIVSGALLVILLLLIGLYALAGRRRAARRSQAAAAGWSRQPHSRYPRAAPAADADGMLEFFAAAPVAEPAAAMARTAARASRPMATDGVFAGGPSPVSRDPFASRLTAPAVVPYESQDAGSASPLGPASKAVTKRPPVSGAPPWEEASQPQGELPWSSPATRDQAHGRHSATPGGGAAGPAAPLPTRTGSLWDRAAHARPAEPDGREDAGLRPGPDLRAVPSFQPRPVAAPQPGPDLRPAAAFQPEPSFQPGPDLRPAAAFQPEPSFQPGPDVRPAAAFEAGAYEPDPYLPPATSQFGERSSGPQGTQPGHRVPDRPGQSLTGRLNWSQEPSPEPAPRDAAFPPPLQQPAEQRSANSLPVRQPRTPTPPPALSPSGSLWERAVDNKPAPADSEPGGRPIFVWNPAAGTETFPAEPAELGPRLGNWSVLGRHQEQSPD